MKKNKYILLYVLLALSVSITASFARNSISNQKNKFNISIFLNKDNGHIELFNRIYPYLEKDLGFNISQQIVKKQKIN